MDDSLKFLTRNLRILPPLVANGFIHVPYLNTEEKNKRLVHFACEYLDTEKYDILCFQELFGESRRMWLMNEAERAGYTSWCSNNGYHCQLIPFFFANDGLMIFVNPKKVTQLKLHDEGTYNRAASTDRFAMKGWVCVSFLYERKRIALFNTHIQSSNGDPSMCVRKSNLDDLRCAIEKVKRKDPSIVVILCGDLNIDFELQQGCQLFNDSLSHCLTLKNLCTDLSIKTFPETSERLDYVLVDNTNRGVYFKEERVLKTDTPIDEMSDHLPVSGRIVVCPPRKKNECEPVHQCAKNVCM